jgi:hypothetical protein
MLGGNQTRPVRLMVENTDTHEERPGHPPMELLRTLDADRHGATGDDLARELAVTKRAILARQAGASGRGLPPHEEIDGQRTRWTLLTARFKVLADLGVSMVELSSLDMGRALVDGMAGIAVRSGACGPHQKDR